MTSDKKLESALARLREVDADAADELESVLSDAADVADAMLAWKLIATRLAKMVRSYQTISPN